MDEATLRETCRRFGLTVRPGTDHKLSVYEGETLRFSYDPDYVHAFRVRGGAVDRVRTLGDAIVAAFPPVTRSKIPARRWTISVERTVATDLSGFRYAVYLYRGAALKAKVATDAVQPFAAAFFDGEMPVEVLAGWIEDNAGV